MSDERPTEETPPAPTVIPPSPVPTTIQWRTAVGEDGTPYVVLLMHTPTGTSVSYIAAPGDARRMGAALIQMAEVAVENAHGGIVPASPEDLKSLGNGHGRRNRG